MPYLPLQHIVLPLSRQNPETCLSLQMRKTQAGPRVSELFTVAFTVARCELFSCCVVKLEFGSDRRSSLSVMLFGHWSLQSAQTLQSLGERSDVPWTFPDW